MRYSLKTLSLLLLVAAFVCGWAADHNHLANKLRIQAEDATQRETQLKNGLRIYTYASDTWCLADVHKSVSKDEFGTLLVSKQLNELWELHQNEADLNAIGDSSKVAGYLASQILYNLGCEDADDLYDIAASTDRALLADVSYDLESSESKPFREFIERALAENTNPF